MKNNLSERIEIMERNNELAPFPVYSTEIINDLKIRNKMVTKKDNYNNVPVVYCTTCLSLKTKTLKEPNVVFCESCSNTDMSEIHIEEWDKLYEERYGENFLKGERI